MFRGLRLPKIRMFCRSHLLKLLLYTGIIFVGHAASSVFEQTPSNTVSSSGHPSQLSCSTTPQDLLFEWKLYPNHTKPTTVISIYKSYIPGFVLDKTKYGLDGQDLVIKMTNMTSAGTYSCNVLDGSHEYGRFAAVRVLTGPPSCAAEVVSNRTTRFLFVKEGENVNLTCSVNYDVYSDDWLPQLEWSKNRPTRVPSPVSVTSAGRNYRTVWSRRTIELTELDDDRVFTCRAYFDDPPGGFFNMMRVGADDVADEGAPDSDRRCDVHIRVLYGARNLSIHPEADDGVLTARLGQEVVCSARGNPEPEIRWQLADIWVNHSVLPITSDLVNGSFFNCTAANDYGTESLMIQILILYDHSPQDGSTRVSVLATVLLSLLVVFTLVGVATGATFCYHKKTKKARVSPRVPTAAPAD